MDQSTFHNPYPGIKAVLDGIIKPVFGELETDNEDIIKNNQLEQQANQAKISKITRIASAHIGIPINIFDVELEDGVVLARNRVSVKSLLVRLAMQYSAALIFFHYANTKAAGQQEWRISFFYKEGKLKDITAPKRYTFLCGPDHGCRTVAERFQKLLQCKAKLEVDDLLEAFSVEALTAEFYKDLFNWYQWALNCDKVKFPGTAGPNDRRLIRLIARLMFVWFIRQKNMVPSWLFDGRELGKILVGFDADNPSDETGDYYNAILQNLFFATLNCPLPMRKFAKDSSARKAGSKADPSYQMANQFRNVNGGTYFQIGEDEIVNKFSQVPFLNGGLFECLHQKDYGDEDGFSRVPAWRAIIPDRLFFDPNDGLINILGRYNWTVEEDSPDDMVVALDPELLGKVFENLLGACNDETRQSARKAAGSFYTPRQVVQLMVDESLARYIARQVGDGKEGQEDEELALARRFISDSELPAGLPQGYASRACEALTTVKVLDPACGSGAFPIGLLNRIVDVVGKVDPGTDRYNLKLRLIQNCIHGIDREPIATQIAKLRFFISLTCEQEIDPAKPDDNFGIKPLPNLETKFVAADTLIKLAGDGNGQSLFTDKALDTMLEELMDIRANKILRACTYQEKKALRERDEELRGRISLLLGGGGKSKIADYIKRLNDLEQERKKYPEQREEIEGDPLLIADLNAQGTFSVDVNKDKRDDIDSQIRDIKKKIKAAQKQAAGDSQSLVAEQVAGWNPYHPTESAKFFAPAWMFGMKEAAFDIVIGNPPYIRLQNLKKDPRRAEYQAQGYGCYTSGGDIYQLFYERGLQLVGDGGLLCFITSNKWMRAGYGDVTRQYFTTQANPVLLIDMGANVFNSATVDTNIVLVEKKPYEGATKAVTRQGGEIKELAETLQGAENMKFDSGAWVILDPLEKSIKDKITARGVALTDWNISIYRGIVTGCNEAFIIDKAKRDELIKADKKSAEIIRPVLRGRDIKRYGYDFADLYLIATFPSRHYDINNYPAVKKYLEKFGRKRLEQSGAPGSRKKTSNAWFETQDPIASWNDYNHPKIVHSEMVQEPHFYFDKDGKFMVLNTCCYTSGEHLEYLTVLLNSNLLAFAFKRFYAGGGLGNTGFRYQRDYLINLPVIIPTAAQEKKIINSKNPEADIYALYDLTPEEIAYIEANVD